MLLIIGISILSEYVWYLFTFLLYYLHYVDEMAFLIRFNLHLQIEYHFSAFHMISISFTWTHSLFVCDTACRRYDESENI